MARDVAPISRHTRQATRVKYSCNLMLMPEALIQRITMARHGADSTPFNEVKTYKPKKAINLINTHSKRFDELAAEIDQIEAGKVQKHSDFGAYYHVDDEKFDEWRVKAKSLISRACGEDSEHLQAFVAASRPQPFDSNHAVLRRLRPVILASRSDFQGGHLASVRSLVQAELFDSELDQASELLEQGYKGPAAVVAGVVLETSLRDLCDQQSPAIPHGKLDQMNSALAKAGIYNKLQQKRITAIADIRNSAAHGKWSEFSDTDVVDMIRDVQRFLADHLF